MTNCVVVYVKYIIYILYSVCKNDMALLAYYIGHSLSRGYAHPPIYFLFCREVVRVSDEPRVKSLERSRFYYFYYHSVL